MRMHERSKADKHIFPSYRKTTTRDVEKALRCYAKHPERAACVKEKCSLTRALHPLVVVGIDAHLLLLGTERELTAFQWF